MANEQKQRPVYQPLHPSIRDKLDPEYVALHDEVLQYCPRSESQPWDASSRSKAGPMAHGGMKEVEVGRVVDQDLGNIQARVFVPEGEPPTEGWPSFVYFHGGGWVIGGLDSENGFLRHCCKYLRCVVISINYRHAPEYVYPTAINDSYAGFRWAVSPENAKLLSLDISRVSVGGLSAGGGLAAIISMKAALDPTINISILFQMLICPVIDNTATVDTIWSTSQHSPWLTPTRMAWYRQKYFTSSSDAKNWDASPNFAPPTVLAKSPTTFLAVAECDLLAPEDLDFGNSLQSAGVDTEVVVYQGATHSVLILAGIHKAGKSLVHDACRSFAKILDVPYIPDEAPVLPSHS